MAVLELAFASAAGFVKQPLPRPHLTSLPQTACTATLLAGPRNCVSQAPGSRAGP